MNVIELVDKKSPLAPRKTLPWRTNGKGNVTVHLGDCRASCFKAKDGAWRFCITTTAWYDQSFTTQEEAIAAAEAAVKSQLL
jgi:hypothetical protein